MEITGDNKSIRALFSELKFADEQAAPSFAATWHRAVAGTQRPRAFNLAFVAATALLVLVLGSLAVWSKYLQTNNEHAAAVTLQADFPSKSIQKTEATPAPIQPGVQRPRRNTLASQRRALLMAANRKAEQQAKEIANWQSPTSSLLSSSSDGLFKSLPQLNENANELKSFLPSRANEKEK